MFDRYTNGKEPQIYPGHNQGLRLVLDAHTDKLASGTVIDDFTGFVTVVDGKDKYPFTSRNGFVIKAGQENQVILKATRFDADEDTKHIHPLKRNCYFSDEFVLKLHKAYSQSNCFLECKIEKVQKLMFQQIKTWYQ